ncbi:nucleoside monophosphate kinase [Candidatus Saccharibacteria bacterium]|nr:nucleoside monophosphate kinase [Candidatus Saccharibacteria bacterium]
MDEAVKIKLIKSWLGTGAINIFGQPFAGKDTLGRKLAELLGAEFLSSGEIIRSNAGLFTQKAVKGVNNGSMAPQEEFKRIVLPYFGHKALVGKPLILSSVGRWFGEEYPVMNTLIKFNHPTKAVLVLNISKKEVLQRWRVTHENEGRHHRKDDSSEKVVKHRLKEYETKTQPVIDFYARLGLAYMIDSSQPREKTLADTLDTLLHLAQK